MELIFKKKKENNYMDLTIKKAKQGDKEAFVSLIKENKLILFKVAKKILNNEEDIKDVIQETIVKSYNSISNLKRNEFFRTWLIRILINECNKMIKNKKKFVSLETINNIGSYEEDFLSNSIYEVVNSLDEDLKLITILYYYEGFPVKDIAKIIDIPEGTVKSRLSRARNKLFSMLKEGGYINE